MPIDTIHGNLKGLKSSQLKQLQRLYQQAVPGDRLTTPELAQRIAALSTELNQAVCVYLNRRGKVIRVGVGSPRQTQIPPLELPRYGAERLSGIRCLTASPKDEPPKESSLTAMVLQRLDALVSFTLTGTGTTKRGRGAAGYVKNVYVAHLLPQTHPSHAYWLVSESQALEEVSQQDFLDFVEGLEAEFRREFTAQQVDQSHDRVILVGLQTSDIGDRPFQDRLTELARLVDTAGGEVLLTLEQKRSTPHPQTVVGTGKVEEIALQVQTLGANLVVFDRDLSPAQGRNLERQLGVKVCDRTEVILDIFAQRAQSRAGKLQVELAQLEYLLPRLVGRGQAMSRLGGGIGTRGPGETKLETERRTIQSRLSRLQKEVDQLQAHRSRMRSQRQRQDVPTFAIVGYTNAGKSTLINALTNAEVYAADQLFATLDPTTRRLTLTDEAFQTQTILLTDTVGFIHELPPALVDAFRATLEEVTEADALIHVVDLSHPAWLHQLESVEKILGEMPIMPAQALLVFNKLDQVSSEALQEAKLRHPHAVYISASDRLGFETLRQRLAQMLVL
ncbi:GTPase HflX [Picosynechococcus sp. NKBG042902]|uniref:GTPase HflX n=1 Tax=Picosynechococcus sp. NKBG042902 TaxID=490193 RepID=UPI0004AB7BA5|nr:GTPase HflX [Picosynechococcus sp. NKBG042902]